MVRHRSHWTLASILILFAWAVLPGCDVSLSSRATKAEVEPEPLTVSLSQGGTLRYGELIDVTIEIPEESEGEDATPRSTEELYEPEYAVEVRLEHPDGTLITSRVFPHSEEESVPPLTIDDLDLPTGGYRLVIDLLRGEESVVRKTVDFYYIGDDYMIRQIGSDGPSVHPGSTVLLTALLTTPEGSDPHIEWSWSEGVFLRGSLSEGLDQAKWTAPLVEGIYTITVAVFPLGPGSASVPLSADVYVSVVRNPVGELGPAGAYQGLYHLLGDLSDSSAAAQPASFLDGEPMDLLTRGRVVGYDLDGRRGFSVPTLLLPVQEGKLAPFTLTFGYTPPETLSAGQILRMAGAAGDILLTVRLAAELDSAPSIVAELALPDGVSTLEADVSSLRAGVRSSLSFSLAPAVDGPLAATWFVDGLPAASADWAIDALLADNRGSMVVGGQASTLGILDELGVYVRDELGRASTDPDVLRRSIAEQYGASAVADGFDGMYLGPGYLTVGSVLVDRGLLSIGPASSVRLPSIALGSGFRLKLTLGGALDPAALVSLRWAGAEVSEAPLLTLDGAGVHSPSGEITLTVRPEAGTLTIEVQGVSREGVAAPVVTTTVREGTDPAMLLDLANGPLAAATLLLDSYTVQQSQ